MTVDNDISQLFRMANSNNRNEWINPVRANSNNRDEWIVPVRSCMADLEELVGDDDPASFVDECHIL